MHGIEIFMRWKHTTLLCLVTAWIVTSTGLSRDKHKVAYHLERGSRIWINGSATLGSYECKTVAVFGTGDVDSSEISNSDNSSIGRPKEVTRVAVQVKLFDCGNPAMNEDMYSALKSDRDSLISFELEKAEVVSDSLPRTNSLKLKTVGLLSIAGITRLDTIDVVVKKLPGERYEITGRKNLSMLDFNIDPPTAFFGLIKANEKLVVGFDLIAAPESEKIDK